MVTKKDITEQRFTKLVAIKPLYTNSSGRLVWLFKCDCGSDYIADGKRVRNGHTKSCGCLQKDPNFKREGYWLNKKHPEYLKIKHRDTVARRNGHRQEEIYALYTSGLSIPEIAKQTNFSYTWCLKYLKNLKVKTNTVSEAQRIRFFNESFFETIDTEEKAYWLGFITADGCVHDRNYITIGLQERDKNHLEKFVKCIGGDHPIKVIDVKLHDKWFRSARLSIYSKQMKNDLINLGVTQRKSFTAKPCIQVPEELLRHYWRGVFDGDGGIYKHPSNNQWSTNLTMNIEMVEGFRVFIVKFVNTIVKPYIGNRTIWQISFGGRLNVIKIITLLYKDAKIFLDRKMDLAKQVTKDFTL